jgi:hypothetical protein
VLYFIAVTQRHARRRSSTSSVPYFDLTPCASCISQLPLLSTFFPIFRREKNSNFSCSVKVSFYLCKRDSSIWQFHKRGRSQRQDNDSAKDVRHTHEYHPHRRPQFATLQALAKACCHL